MSSASGRAEAIGQQDIEIGVISAQPFCAVGKKHGVPPELLAAVWFAEHQAIALDDRVQDAVFRLLVRNLDDGWWDRWASRSRKLAERASSSFQESGKWPVQVIQSGIVFSIGPAQLTPLTVLEACAYFELTPEVCTGRTKKIIERLLDPVDALELAALILRYERARHISISRQDVGTSLSEWATLYNFGGVRYRYYYSAESPNKKNSFGRFVEKRVHDIRKVLMCNSED